MRLYVILSLVSALAGGAIVYKFVDNVKTVDRVVEHNNVVTVVKTVKAPDGTVTTVEKVTDKSIVSQDHTTVLPNNTTKQNWFMSVGYGTDRQYSAELDKRLVGPMFVGLQAAQNGTVSVKIGFEF